MKKITILSVLAFAVATAAGEGYSVVNGMETMYAGTSAGYHRSTNGNSGAHFELNAAGFWSVGGPHKIGLAFGMGSISDSYDDGGTFKLTSSGVSIQLSPVYRAGERKKYVDASFTILVPILYNLYVELPPYPKEKIYVDGATNTGYSVEVFGRYRFIGAGIGRSLSANITPFSVRGFWTAYESVEIIPAAAYCFGDGWGEFVLSLGVNYFF